MSLLTATQLKTLDYALGGQPACAIALKATISTVTLDYAFGGEPFYAASAVAAGGGPGGSATQTYIVST